MSDTETPESGDPLEQDPVPSAIVTVIVEVDPTNKEFGLALMVEPWLPTQIVGRVKVTATPTDGTVTPE